MRMSKFILVSSLMGSGWYSGLMIGSHHEGVQVHGDASLPTPEEGALHHLAPLHLPANIICLIWLK